MFLPRISPTLSVLLRAGCVALAGSLLANLTHASHTSDAKPTTQSAPAAKPKAKVKTALSTTVLELATNFDAERYMGLWYKAGKVEAAKTELVTRERYEMMLRYDGSIRVIYTHYQPLANQWKRLEDYMEPVNENGVVFHAGQRLSLPITFRISRFGNFFSIDFRTFAIDAHYQWALVKGPGTDSVFVISRTPVVDESLRNSLTQLAKHSYPNMGPIRWVQSETIE